MGSTAACSPTPRRACPPLGQRSSSRRNRGTPDVPPPRCKPRRALAVSGRASGFLARGSNRASPPAPRPAPIPRSVSPRGEGAPVAPHRDDLSSPDPPTGAESDSAPPTHRGGPSRQSPGTACRVSSERRWLRTCRVGSRFSLAGDPRSSRVRRSPTGAPRPGGDRGARTESMPKAWSSTRPWRPERPAESPRFPGTGAARNPPDPPSDLLPAMNGRDR